MNARTPLWWDCPRGKSHCKTTGRSRHSIHADDFARITNDFRGKEGDVASTAADLQHAHAADNPRVAEKPLCDRVDQTRLRLQAFDFPVRMAQYIGPGRISLVTKIRHGSSS